MARIEDTVRRNREVLERALLWMMALLICVIACNVYFWSTPSKLKNKIETMEEKQKHHDRKMSALEKHPLLQGEDGEMLLISSTGPAAEWQGILCGVWRRAGEHNSRPYYKLHHTVRKTKWDFYLYSVGSDGLLLSYGGAHCEMRGIISSGIEIHPDF